MLEHEGLATAKRSRNYFLVLLTIAFVLNFFDRSIVNVLLESIKKEMQLSDTALGFIAGLGFVLLYAILGVPLGRLADLRGRRGVVAFGIALWSVATALGGVAQSGVQLALARTGVGIGEAAGTAPSIAMMSDLFTKDERPRALSILNLGVPLGVFFGIMVGGLANNWFGWRGALFLAGVPGLIVAGLLATAGPLPRVGGATGPRTAEPVWQTLRFLFSQPSYVLGITGSFFSGFALNGLFVWTPSLFARVYGMPPSQVGVFVGTMLGLCGAAGTVAGGMLVTRLGRGDDRWKAGEPAMACLTSAPFLIAMPMTDSRTVALVCLGIGSFLLMSLLGPIYAVYQAVARPQMLSFATSIHNLLGTIGGLGLGALMIGMMSDYLTPRYGVLAIRYAILLPISCTLPAAVLYGLAIRTIRRDAHRMADGLDRPLVPGGVPAA